MDTTPMMTRLEAAIEQQVLVAGGGADVETAAGAMLTALGPALRQAAFELAEQAAAEVAAQLPDQAVDVVLDDGEPTLRVRSEAAEAPPVAGENLDARITVRLPPHLKELVEESARSAGESVNTWLIRTMSSQTGRRRGRAGRTVRGTIET
jgi:hypothetical protein